MATRRTKGVQEFGFIKNGRRQLVASLAPMRAVDKYPGWGASQATD